MPKKKIVKDRGLIINTSKWKREKYRQYYEEKFFNKFLNQFEFTGLEYQQIAYIMRKFWSRGTVASYKVPMTESEMNPEGEIIFTPYAPAGMWNIYDYPTAVSLVNTRGVSFIPSVPVPLDEEGGACIGYIQKDRKGIIETIGVMIDKIVDFEITISTNLKAMKTPWIIGVSPENSMKMKQLWENLDSDDPVLFVSIEELQTAKALVSGANYNIDKLENQRQQVENEILTRLGIQNLGVMEKKEHLITNEIDSNNEQVNSSGNEFIDCMNEFFTNIKKWLGKSISVKLKEVQCEQPQEQDDNMEEEQDDEQI